MWYREAMKVVSFHTPKGCRIWCVRQSIDIGCNKFKPLTTILSILAIMKGPCSGKHNSKINSYNNYMHESSWAVYWQNYGGRERDSENGGDGIFRQYFGVWKMTTFLGSRYRISNRFKASHGLRNPCGSRVGSVTGRVGVGYFQPLANPYPHHGLAVTREKPAENFNLGKALIF